LRLGERRVLISFMIVIPPLTALDRFALTLDGLCRAVAGRIAGQALSAVMIVLIWRRVRRVQTEILGLLARFRTGRLRVRTVARSGGGGGRVGRKAGALPVRFGWLLPLVPHEAACFAGQVRSVLAEPEMAALLEASPRARRVMGPLCRMLGIEAEALAPATGETAVVRVVGWHQDESRSPLRKRTKTQSCARAAPSG